MNKNLEDALFDIAKVDAIMQSIEAAYLDVAVKEEAMNGNAKENLHFTLYGMRCAGSRMTLNDSLGTAE